MSTDRVILRVNDRIATLYDYQARYDERLRMIQQADLEPDKRAEMVDQAGEEVMSNLLEELLVLSRADQIGYLPTEEEIDDAVERTKENFGIKTDEQYKAALASSGMTEADFRRQVGMNLRVSGVMAREVQRRVDLSEEDLRRYYYEHEDQFTTPERVELREVVVLDDSPLSTEEREALAEKLRTEMAGGAVLSEIVAPYRDEGTTSDVVDLGWVKKGDLDPALEDAVWDLEAGQVSAPVRGRGGLHVLRVVDREEATVLPFNQVQDQIDRVERERLMRQEYGSYLQELRDAAYIRVHYLPPGAEDFDVEESASRMHLEGAAAESLSAPAPSEQAPSVEQAEPPSADESEEPSADDDGEEPPAGSAGERSPTLTGQA